MCGTKRTKVPVVWASCSIPFEYVRRQAEYASGRARVRRNRTVESDRFAERNVYRKSRDVTFRRDERNWEENGKRFQFGAIKRIHAEQESRVLVYTSPLTLSHTCLYVKMSADISDHRKPFERFSTKRASHTSAQWSWRTCYLVAIVHEREWKRAPWSCAIWTRETKRKGKMHEIYLRY